MKRYIRPLAISSICAILAACGSSKTDNGPAAGTGGDKAGQAGNKPKVELTIVTSAAHTEESFNSRFGDSIRQKFPDYTIKYIPSSTIKFADLVPTQTQVDIVYAAINDFMSGPVKHGMAYDMKGLIASNGIDTGRVATDWLTGLKPMWKDNIYGLPVSMEALTLFYNKDLFDKFGIAYPTDGMSWDQVFELNQKLSRSDQGVQYAGIAIAAPQHFTLNALSLSYYDMQAKKPGVVQQEAKWKQLYETLAVLPLQSSAYREKVVSLKGALPGEANFVKQRDTAMLAGLAHLPLSQAEMKEVNWDMVSYPTFRDAPKTGSQGNLLLFGVTNMSKHKEEALQVIKYLYSDEFQTITSRDGNIPAIVSDERVRQFAQNTYYKDRNVQSLFVNKFAPLSERTEYDPSLSPVYRKYINQLVSGELDMNTMLRKVAEDTEKAVAEVDSR